jgi:protein gp37
MAENSHIQWCDHTRNFWSGCTKVSPACKFCYAEKMAKINRIYGRWGPGAPRSWHGDGAAKEIAKWNETAGNVAALCERRADEMPHRPRVFLNSMSDWLDDEVPVEWLASLLDSIRRAPNLDFLLLTKRPENFAARVEAAGCSVENTNPDLWAWIGDWFLLRKPRANVWIGATVEDKSSKCRIDHLRRIPALVRFLSCEPLLEDLGEIGEWAEPHDGGAYYIDGIHWIIAGGESGKHARPSHPDWFHSLRDQSAAAGVPFFFKQWGEWCLATEEHGVTGHVMPDSGIMPCGKRAAWIGWDGKTACPSANGLLEPVIAIARLGKGHTGRLLDGVEHNAFPA